MKIKIGIVLILLSGVCWFSVFATPWLPFSTPWRLASGAALFTAAQVAWWSGSALVGADVIARFWPRHSKSPDRDSSSDQPRPG